MSQLGPYNVLYKTMYIGHKLLSGQIGPLCNNNKKTVGQKPELLILAYPT